MVEKILSLRKVAERLRDGAHGRHQQIGALLRMPREKLCRATAQRDQQIQPRLAEVRIQSDRAPAVGNRRVPLRLGTIPVLDAALIQDLRKTAGDLALPRTAE